MKGEGDGGGESSCMTRYSSRFCIYNVERLSVGFETLFVGRLNLLLLSKIFYCH